MNTITITFAYSEDLVNFQAMLGHKAASHIKLKEVNLDALTYRGLIDLQSNALRKIIVNATSAHGSVTIS